MSQTPPEPPPAPAPGGPHLGSGLPVGGTSTPTGGPHRRSSMPLVVAVAVVLAAVLVGGGVLLLTGDDADDDAGASPEATVDAFLAAVRQDDCVTMLGLVTDNMLDDISRREAEDSCQDGSLGEFFLGDELERSGSAETRGDRSRVEAVGTEDDTSVVFELVRTDDGWKVDGLDDIARDTSVPDQTPDGPDDVHDGAGSGQGADDGEPVPVAEEVVQQFLTAAYGGDCETMLDLVTESTLDGLTRDEALEECESGASTVEPYDGLVVVGSASLSDDRVNVGAEHTTEGLEGANVEFELVRQDGAWLIDEIIDYS